MNTNAPEIPADFLAVWNVLNISYPNFCKEQGGPALLSTLQLYYQLLADIPIKQLKAAVLRHVSASKWFPTIAELRTAQATLSMAPLPSAVEAWGEVLDAMTSSEHYCFFDHVMLPEFANPITARLISSMGWRNLCQSENQIADRARFIGAYEQLATRQTDERSLPPQLQAGAGAIGHLVGEVARKLTGPDWRQI